MRFESHSAGERDFEAIDGGLTGRSGAPFIVVTPPARRLADASLAQAWGPDDAIPGSGG